MWAARAARSIESLIPTGSFIQISAFEQASVLLFKQWGGLIAKSGGRTDGRTWTRCRMKSDERLSFSLSTSVDGEVIKQFLRTQLFSDFGCNTSYPGFKQFADHDILRPEVFTPLPLPARRKSAKMDRCRLSRLEDPMAFNASCSCFKVTDGSAGAPELSV